MKKILISNQKMFLSYDEAKELRNELEEYNNKNLIICPNFLNMKLYKDFNVSAQNCHYEEHGSFTGEVSPYHLSLLGVKYVLVGHSERRTSETDEVINKKVLSILKNYMTPILCIGETKLDKEMHRVGEVLKKQLVKSLKNVSLLSDQEIFIAYEPRWVIGSGKSLSKNEIEDTMKYIKKILDELEITNYKLLYGGSVNDENIDDICKLQIDGYLIGNASVDIKKIKTIIDCIK